MGRIPPQIEGTGSPFVQADNEEVSHVFNFTNRLPSAQTVSSATVKAYDLDAVDADVSATVLGTPAVSSPSVTVTVKTLTVGKSYRVECLATFSGGAKELIAIEVQCPF